MAGLLPHALMTFKCCTSFIQFFGLNSCGISLGQRKRRQDDSEERLPPEVFTAAERLMNSGIFEYGM